MARISTVYQRNSIIGLDTDNSVGRENSGVQRCVPERSVSSSTNGVTRNSKADPERRPVNRSSSYAIPFLASQRGSNPSLLRSIDSPYAPLNIHETISGTIEPDLHRFYCVSREDLVVNKNFFSPLSLNFPVFQVFRFGSEQIERNSFHDRPLSPLDRPRVPSREMERNESFEGEAQSISL